MSRKTPESIIIEHLVYIKKISAKLNREKGMNLSEEDLEDVVHETVVKILDGAFDSFRGDCSETSYLWYIVRGTICDYARKVASYPNISFDDALVSDAVSDLDHTNGILNEMENAEIKNIIENEIKTMSGTRQLIYAMHIKDKLTQQEIAQTLNFAQSTVSEHWNKIKIQLKQVVKNGFPDKIIN